MKHDAYIGIDPGSSGAIALISVDGTTMLFDLKEGPAFCRQWLNAARLIYNIRIIMIEKVSSVQGASAGSNFKFGWNAGGINWVAETMGIGVDHVTPKRWQQYLGCKQRSSSPGKALKKEIATNIERLYPQASIKGPRGGLLDGRSDALAIAHYARHKWQT